MTESKLKALYQHYDEAILLKQISNLLHWDKQTHMPKEGASSRAQQHELISRLHHQRLVNPEFIKNLAELDAKSSKLSERDRVNVKELKRKSDNMQKLSEDFVARKSRATNEASTTWIAARPNNDFAAVEPHLDKIFDLVKEEADLLGYEEHPYDAKLDNYEPGLTLSLIKPLLTDLGEELRKIIPTLTERFADVEQPNGHFPLDLQHKLNARIIEDFGYDFSKGNLTAAPHPFQTTIGVNDHRVTTRYYEDDYLKAPLSTMHEAGHALYELGLDRDQLGLPMGDSISLGVHESLSRLWENIVGRSKAYSVHLHRILGGFFPAEQKNSSPDLIWQQLNQVKPSLIRVEADEVSYSLHIVIRMLIEEQIMSGEVRAKDLPDLWKQNYEHFLGITPPDDKDGAMQDVHWFWGAVGYFPTYALGNVLNGMYLERILTDIPDLYSQIESGKFDKLLGWLNTNIHQHGMKYKSFELVENLTGKKVSSAGFLKYIRDKHSLS